MQQQHRIHWTRRYKVERRRYCYSLPTHFPRETIARLCAVCTYTLVLVYTGGAVLRADEQGQSRGVCVCTRLGVYDISRLVGFVAFPDTRRGHFLVYGTVRFFTAGVLTLRGRLFVCQAMGEAQPPA